MSTQDCGHPGWQRLYRGIWRCRTCLNREIAQVLAATQEQRDRPSSEEGAC